MPTINHKDGLKHDDWEIIILLIFKCFILNNTFTSIKKLALNKYLAIAVSSSECIYVDVTTVEQVSNHTSSNEIKISLLEE